MKTLSALATATALTLATATAGLAEEVTPLNTTKSTQEAGLALGGLGVAGTAGIVLASALLLTVIVDDDDDSSTTTSSTE